MKLRAKLFSCLLASIIPSSLLFAQVELRTDAGKAFLSNSRLSVLFDTKGGRIIDFRSLPGGANFVVPNPGGAGMHVLEQYSEKRSDYESANYQISILKNSPQEAVVELSALGKQDNYGFCSISKKIASSAKSMGRLRLFFL